MQIKGKMIFFYIVAAQRNPKEATTTTTNWKNENGTEKKDLFEIFFFDFSLHVKKCLFNFKTLVSTRKWMQVKRKLEKS